jgi:hypothetical protein
MIYHQSTDGMIYRREYTDLTLDVVLLSLQCTFFNQKHKWRTSCCEMCATPRSEATEQCVDEGQHVNVD